MRVWDLPGPRSFIEAVAEDARGHGLVAIIGPPHLPDGIDDVLHDSLRLSHNLYTLQARGGNPLSDLSDAFGSDLRSARSLAEDRRAFGKAVLLMGLPDDMMPRWDVALRAFAGNRRAREAAIILAVVQPRYAPMFKACGARLQLWKGKVTRTDATLFALTMIDQPRHALLDRLAVEIAVSLCGWDLMGVAEEVARRSRARSELIATPSRVREADRPVWEKGLCDMFDGAPFVKLESLEPREVRHRLWRGQVAILFGWLEELRLAFAKNLGSSLKQVDDPLSLEWGDLAHLLRGRPPRDAAELAERCRRARNRLAHGEPLNWDELSDLLRRAQRRGLTAGWGI